MARKRKIPTRKHHGIRDPLKQQEEREKKLRNVVNNPPESGGDQKVSFKFAEFKKLADNAKAGKKLKRIHIGQEDLPSITTDKTSKKSRGPKGVGGKKLSNIKQLADETDKNYLRRVNRITTESLREAEYEAKYGVTVVRNQKTGEISIVKKPKNEIDELLKQKRSSGKNVKNRKISTKQPIDPKTARELIKQAIREDEEEKKLENSEIEEYKRDVFKFGEVVQGPPTISTLPRKATKSETVPRPGKKDNLLLKSLLNKTPSTTKEAPKSSKAKQPINSIGIKAKLKGKRKDLPAATRAMLENEQSKMIELYRQLKKSKEKQNFQ